MPLLKNVTDRAVFLLVTLVILGVGGVGYFFQQRSYIVLDGLLKEKLQNAATLGAMQFGENERAFLRNPSVQNARQYSEITQKLLAIKNATPDARYVYILKRTEDPMVLEFVADADAALPRELLDENVNGVIDEIEEPSMPGDSYEIDDVPALQQRAFIMPTTDEEFTEDVWGEFLSGYAPIRGNNGEVLGVLGIDMLSTSFQNQLDSIFTVYAFLILAGVVIILVSSTILVFAQRHLQSVREIEEERQWLSRLAMHQVGNALSIFRFTTETLKDRLAGKCTSLGICDQIDDLEQGIERLDTMFTKLMTAESIQQKSLSYSPEECNVYAFLNQEAEKFADRNIVIDAEKNLVGNFDQVVLSGVVHELLTNAVRFSEQETPITLHAHKERAKLIIRVEDNGIGIDKQDLPHVFERLYVGKETWERNPKALGLGLFIVKGIVEHISGTVDIRTKEGIGTAASICIPA